MYLCIFPFAMYLYYMRGLFCNLWEAIDLLCKRIMRSSTGNIQIATGCLIGAIGTAIGIHLIQSRIGQSTWYRIAGHAMWSQMRSFFSHLGKKLKKLIKCITKNSYRFKLCAYLLSTCACGALLAIISFKQLLEIFSLPDADLR